MYNILYLKSCKRVDILLIGGNMSKITVDINYVKDSLKKIGYIVSDCVERNNNGLNWQLKFSNSGAIVTIYDTNNVKNSVVNGKLEPKKEEGEKDKEEEGEKLKEIVDKIKCKELQIDPLNEEIIKLIDKRQEADFYDYKSQWHEKEKIDDLLHDIICLSNNIGNKDAYLIIGVADNGEVVGIDEGKKTNEIYDFLRSKKFAGDHMPQIEVKRMFYKYKKIDVLVCKSSKYVPFYLVERSNGVHDHQIYTRVGDTNTPINGHANYSDVEKLWRIHFQREKE